MPKFFQNIRKFFRPSVSAAVVPKMTHGVHFKFCLPFEDDECDMQTRVNSEITRFAREDYDYIVYPSHSPIIPYHLKSVYRDSVPFCVKWWISKAIGDRKHYTKLREEGWTGDTYIESLEKDFVMWFENYIINRWYYMRDGRPVIFIGSFEKAVQAYGVFGTDAHPKRIIALLREVAARFGFAGNSRPYIIEEDALLGMADVYRQCGFDAITGLEVIDSLNDFDMARVRYSEYWERLQRCAEKAKMEFLVPNFDKELNGKLAEEFASSNLSQCGGHIINVHTEGYDFISLRAMSV
jgi:hypothetical protein